MTYEERVTKQYNEFAEEYEKAVEEKRWEDASFYSFLCNAINGAVLSSTRHSLYEYFQKHALST